MDFGFSLINGWEPYIGYRSGLVKQDVDISGSRVGPLYEVQNISPSSSYFGGLRKGDVSLEIGAGPLSSRNSHNKSDTYDIRQDISTDFAYLAALKHFQFGRFAPHLLGGVARVGFDNHEYGSNENGPNQEHRNSGSGTYPMLGVGFQWSPDFLKPLSVRGDYFKLNGVAESHWTKKSDVSGGFLGLQYKF